MNEILEITSASATSKSAGLIIVSPAPTVAWPINTRVQLTDLVRLDADTIEIAHRLTADGFLSGFQVPTLKGIE